VYGNIFVNSV